MTEINQLILKKLPKKFYLNNTLKVAKQLIGKLLVYNSPKGLITGIIVETEAYIGAIDESAHSYRGKTLRNQVMFEEGGLLYVYFTYGMHFCLNVVTGKKDVGNAVLIRAVEPINGLDILGINRFNKEVLNEKEIVNLTNGPAKLCQAFGIDKSQNGYDLCSDDLFIANYKTIKKDKINFSTRIGIRKSVEFPWRNYIVNNKYVSKK